MDAEVLVAQTPAVGPFRVPSDADLPARLATVLAVVYLAPTEPERRWLCARASSAGAAP